MGACAGTKLGAGSHARASQASPAPSLSTLEPLYLGCDCSLVHHSLSHGSFLLVPAGLVGLLASKVPSVSSITAWPHCVALLGYMGYVSMSPEPHHRVPHHVCSIMHT